MDGPLKQLVQQYLMTGAGEKSVTILTSKVAQKSYGTEKRFLCPPPTTILKGAHWWTSSAEAGGASSHKNYYSSSRMVSGPKLTIQISGESIHHGGNIEWYTASGAIVDNSSPLISSGEGDGISGKCVSKHLHINDADEKRKRVEVLVNVQLGDGSYLGILPSRGIKVISKPSKKRQSVKNMELCIHHGTTISLFNRIRSQTVSTKYLGVSSNGQQHPSAIKAGNNTCFVARTGSWDPFIIWVVDPTRNPETSSPPPPQFSNAPFPPPAIALQTNPQQQPLPVHYNQPVVLQCVTTGLVSPVMIIRKVDRGSLVLGGNQVNDLSCVTGGEYGDEAIGDPVSQLHKVAFQIVQDASVGANHQHAQYENATSAGTAEPHLPKTSKPSAYLACLNDVVGMHKVLGGRTMNGRVADLQRTSDDLASNAPDTLSGPNKGSLQRRRTSSQSDIKPSKRRGSLMEGRRGSIASGCPPSGHDGACWTEDVSDAATWTIVGTDSAQYTFWTPTPHDSAHGLMSFSGDDASPSYPIFPFPVVESTAGGDNSLLLTGEHLTRDLSVWFGDVRAPRTEHKSTQSIRCIVPDTETLMSSPITLFDPISGCRKLPILLVRGDGVVYNTELFHIIQGCMTV
ncbi:beta-trefoil DNA-binding domain-containing protein [Radiomyces spectabilis]|uniref:beta-trefoil DNA-binding domain-containing protein n=1 Tax=Radiomyces spectabilis TaxID=64574 RepID=UPI0022205251|nr:beta-trefoil DNA-binding domain-containing protein [Radiomyces spectabilis]KAI8388280.1 beta-trefoil DNA-binding domain-containing protein [Radiomyces spectabilis]